MARTGAGRGASGCTRNSASRDPGAYPCNARAVAVKAAVFPPLLCPDGHTPNYCAAAVIVTVIVCCTPGTLVLVGAVKCRPIVLDTLGSTELRTNA